MSPLDYARLGLAVFACHYPVVNGTAMCSCGNPTCKDAAKHPYYRHAPNGFKNASTDPRAINRWISGPFNVAIATGAVSKISVLDVDPRHRGDESLARLEAEHGPLPSTWRVLSGGGGEHIYFAHPGGFVSGGEGKIAPGIDLKADGGYVIAPPSMHICGRRYAWSVDYHPDLVELAPMPAWLVEKIKASDSANRVKKDWRGFGAEPIIEGSRHNKIKSLAGLLFYRLSREPHLAAELLIAFNAARCTPPLDEVEIESIIEWAASREIQRRRSG